MWYRVKHFGVIIMVSSHHATLTGATKKIRLKKNKKRTPRFLAISENFEHRFGPLKIKIFQI